MASPLEIAIGKLCPLAQFVNHDGTYEGIVWSDERPKPSKADVERQMASVTKREKIAAVFEAKVAAGVAHRGKVIQVDDTARSNIISMALTAKLAIDGAVPWPAEMTNVGWRTKDNSYLPMTAPQMMTMALTCMQAFMAMRYRYGALKDAVTAAPDAAAVDAIDETAGW